MKTGQFKSPGQTPEGEPNTGAVAAAERMAPMTNKDWEKRAKTARNRRGIPLDPKFR